MQVPKRENYKIGKFQDDVRWDALDEDIHIDSLMENAEPNKENEIALIFRRFPQLNVSETAKTIGIDKSLLARYIYGIKKPSDERKSQIINKIRQIGQEMSMIGPSSEPERMEYRIADERVDGVLADEGAVCPNLNRTSAPVKPYQVPKNDVSPSSNASIADGDKIIVIDDSNTMHYKGLAGTVEYSAPDDVLHGKVVGMPKNICLTYEGKTLSKLKKDFASMVDEYQKNGEGSLK